MNVRNIIGGKHALTPKDWTLSYVRRKEEDHCFLVIEGINAMGNRFIKEAHLGFRTMKDSLGKPIKDEHGKPKKNLKKAQIFFFEADIEELKELGKNCVSKTWHLDSGQGENLEKKILADQSLDIDYIRFGKSKGAGFLGASLDSVSSHELKEASIKTSDPLLESKTASVILLHASVNASLQTGHSCVSWARETALVTLQGRASGQDLDVLKEPLFINVPLEKGLTDTCLIL